MVCDTDLRHIITILYNAHGLNLYLKDTMKLPWFQQLHTLAQTITTAFSRSNGMWWLLMFYHKPLNNGKETRIQATGDTRWITLINMFMSLAKLKNALKLMVDDEKCTLSEDVKSIINNKSFWIHMNEAVAIMKLFNNAIIESQSSQATMPTVLPRWIQLRQALLDLQKAEDFKAPIQQIIHGSEDIRTTRRSRTTITGFEERLQRQVNCHHYAAYYLNHNNIL
jgi:hypothetical protein